MCRQCGNLKSVCSDPDRDWHPGSTVCWPAATVEWAKRRLVKKHEDAEVPEDHLHPLDGLSVYATEFEPDEPLF